MKLQSDITGINVDDYFILGKNIIKSEQQYKNILWGERKGRIIFFNLFFKKYEL